MKPDEKWGNALKDGYVLIPRTLLKMQVDLDLSPAGLNVLLHLISAWWSRNELPFPSIETIANQIGVSPRSVHRYVTELESKQLIRRVPLVVIDPSGSQIQVVAFDLEPLVNKLNKL